MQSRHALHKIFVVRINRSGGRVRVCPGPGATSMHTQDGVYQICNVTIPGLINSTVLIVLIFTKLREGNVFTGVCLFRQGGGRDLLPTYPISTYFLYFPPPTYLPLPTYPPTYPYLLTRYSLLLTTPLWSKAISTRPTGMYSCFPLS